LSAILDFEDLKIYPVAAASGFAALKLIRQVLVNHRPEEWAVEGRKLASVWLEAWSRHMPDYPLTVSAIGRGAEYRVLGLLHLMFDGWLRNQDVRYNFDFPKQMGSLLEIDVIFGTAS
jgi:hypothetical protein